MKGLLFALLVVSTIGCLDFHVNHFHSIGQSNGPAGMGVDDQFGYDLDIIGDVDGDGVNDIIVGARDDNDNGNDAGSVYIIFMNTDGSMKSSSKISADVGGNLEVRPSAGHFFGGAVAGIGDIDNDGVPDVMVGSFGYSLVYLIFLTSSGTVKGVKLFEDVVNDSSGQFPGSGTDGQYFGRSVAGVGDQDGNGVPDVMIGASDTDEVWMVYLKSDGTTLAAHKFGTNAGGLDSSDVPSGYQFGRSVCRIGDINGDGNDDFAVGQHLTAAGRVYVFLMSATQLPISYYIINDPAMGNILSSDDFFGVSVAGPGDVDGDGVPDLIIGANGDDDGGTNKGAFYLIYLTSAGTMKSWQKVSSTVGQSGMGWGSYGSFGTGLACSNGHFNDGLVEILVGIPDDGNYGSFMMVSLGCQKTCLSSTASLYDSSNCDTSGWKLTESACSVECISGATGSPTATCGTTGGTFSYSGCSAQCFAPVDPKYSTASCNTGSGPLTATECTAACAPGYTGIAADSCTSAGGTFVFSGCSICPVNTYKASAGPGSCQSCRENSASPQGSTSASACVCVSGFKEDGGDCVPLTCLRETEDPSEVNACVEAESAFGGSCDWTCASGYVGTPRSRTCSNPESGGYGTWTGAAIVCSPVQCAREVPAVGEVNSCPGNTNYPDACTWTCDTGYSGPTVVRQCSSSQLFTGDPPECLADCPVVAISGGSWSCTEGTSVPSGTTCDFNSSPGPCTHTGTRTCTDGAWDEDPYCEDSCSLAAVQGGSWSCGGSTAVNGSVCGFAADPGYSCTNTGNRTCNGGVWSIPKAVCNDKNGCEGVDVCGVADTGATCLDLPAPSTGHTCACTTGFEEQGGICVDVEGCVGNTCAAIDSGATCVDIAAPGTGYECSCSPGYSDDGGTCVGNPCSPPSLYAGASIGTCGGTTAHGSTCQLTCNTGYHLAAFPAEMTCSATSWSTSMECIPDSCEEAPLVLNGDDAINAVCAPLDHGRTCVLNCLSGYVRSGHFECNFGIWNNPTCDLVTTCDGEPRSGPFWSPASGCAGGEGCEVVCRPGYQPVKDYICHGGVWEDGECAEIDGFCVLPNQSNGTANVTGNCDLKINGECGPFACPPGTELSFASDVSVCSERASSPGRGQWLPPVPTCVVVGEVESEAPIVNSPPSTEGSSSTVVALVVVSVLLCLCVAVVLLIAGRRTMHKRAKRARHRDAMMSKEDGTVVLDLNGDFVGQKVDELLDSGKAKIIGSGGAAIIYKAQLNGEWVAIKKLRGAGEAQIQEFHKEITILSKLMLVPAHPNVIRLIYCAKDASCTVMELCTKGSLKTLLGGRKKYDMEQKLSMIRDIGSGMAHLHSVNIVHNDIKPHNVLVSEDNVLKIADFGTSEEVSGPVVPGIFAGTVQYAAPERFRTNEAIDLKMSDSYSLAVTAWYILTLKEPFEGVAAADVVLLKREGKEETWDKLPQMAELQHQAIMSGLGSNPYARPTMEQWRDAFSDMDVTVQFTVGSIGAPGLNSGRYSFGTLGGGDTSLMMLSQTGSPDSNAPLMVGSMHGSNNFHDGLESMQGSSSFGDPAHNRSGNNLMSHRRQQSNQEPMLPPRPRTDSIISNDCLRADSLASAHADSMSSNPAQETESGMPSAAAPSLAAPASAV